MPTNICTILHLCVLFMKWSAPFRCAKVCSLDLWDYTQKWLKRCQSSCCVVGHAQDIQYLRGGKQRNKNPIMLAKYKFCFNWLFSALFASITDSKNRHGRTQAGSVGEIQILGATMNISFPVICAHRNILSTNNKDILPCIGEISTQHFIPTGMERNCPTKIFWGLKLRQVQSEEKWGQELIKPIFIQRLKQRHSFNSTLNVSDVKPTLKFNSD